MVRRAFLAVVACSAQLAVVLLTAALWPNMHSSKKWIYSNCKVEPEPAALECYCSSKLGTLSFLGVLMQLICLVVLTLYYLAQPAFSPASATAVDLLSVNMLVLSLSAALFFGLPYNQPQEGNANNIDQSLGAAHVRKSAGDPAASGRYMPWTWDSPFPIHKEEDSKVQLRTQTIKITCQVVINAEEKTSFVSFQCSLWGALFVTCLFLAIDRYYLKRKAEPTTRAGEKPWHAHGELVTKAPLLKSFSVEGTVLI